MSDSLRIGIDLGGTKIEGVVLDSEYNELYRIRIDTETDGGYEHVVGRISWLYRRLVESIHGEPHTLGIGTPGSISQRTGLLKNSNATVLNGNPLAGDLAKIFGRTFSIENDANCFAIAEATSGAGRGYANVLGIVLGTGVGSGVVLHGQLLTGRHKIAGEWGHMSIDPNGPRCYCGRRGCVERYISGSALQMNYQEATGHKASAKTIVDFARIGAAPADVVLSDFLGRYAFAMANIIAVIDPDIVVVGGGLADVDEIYSIGTSGITSLVFNDEFSTPIVKNSLGSSSGVLGAAMIGA